MNKTALLSALGAFILTSSGLLITLWTGIDTFSAVKPPAYGVALLTGLAAGVQAYRARMADKPGA
jgi:hypothetical protein